MKTAVIIGGGITGLTAMYYLQKLKTERRLDLELILVEQNNDLGGKIHTVKSGEFIMETGADSIVARNEAVMPLLKELDLQDEIVYNATGSSYIYANSRLHLIPEDTVFGIPASLESLFSSTLISTKGKIAALRDLITTNNQFTKESSIALFLESFLGKELVENQISPVLSGVYSGRLDKLTLASTLPYLVDYKNQYGSIIKGLSKNKKRFQASGNKKFISFKNGLSTLINRLEEELGSATILKGISTTNLTKKGDRYEISFTNHKPIAADFVVISTPHQVTQKLLANKQLDMDFNQLTNSSLISIYAGFTIPDSVLPANGTGFIVSGHSDLHCEACTWSSRKWAHTSKNQHLLVRLFYKSSNPFYESLNKMSELEIVQAALSDIEKSIGVKEKPETVEITYWNELMPNYNLNHSKAVQSIKQKLNALFPNVIAAGASYYGVGIGACIKNGKETAEFIAEKIRNE